EDVAPLPLLDDDAGQRAEEPADDCSDGPADDWSDEPLDDAVDEPLPPLPLLDSPAADSRHAADDLYGVSTVDFSAEPEAQEPLPTFEPEPLPTYEAEPLPTLTEPEAPEQEPEGVGASAD